MKLVKMSLAAAMLMGASAYAIDNAKFDGSVKVIYQTNDIDGSANDMFDQGASAAGVGLTLGASSKLSDNLTGAVEMTAFDTLGLESNMVSGVMATGSTKSQAWASLVNVAYTAGKTTVVIGRQELNTPLAFTEKWNVVKNTFDAAVIVNSDIPNTTLVGAYVGKGNGGFGGGGQTANGSFTSYQAVTTLGVNLGDGAYAAGVVFAGVPNTTLQGWYYDVNTAADAFWLQADGKVALGDGMSLSYGAQYANIEVDGQLGVPGDAETDMFALKVGFDVAGVHMFGAYSDASEGVLGFANTATGDKTKMYTGSASIFADGANVATPDTEAFKLGVKTKAGSVTLAANYTDWDQGLNAGAVNARAAEVNQDAWDISAGTTVAGIGMKAIYTSWDTDRDPVVGSRDTLRLILSTKF